MVLQLENVRNDHNRAIDYYVIKGTGALPVNEDERSDWSCKDSVKNKIRVELPHANFERGSVFLDLRDQIETLIEHIFVICRFNEDDSHKYDQRNNEVEIF